MPNRWESSTRPLSVKTVYVNGSRHAILSPEDPILHSDTFSFKKQSRPNSSMSVLSTFSISSSEDSISVARGKSFKSEKIRGRRRKNTPAMLQDCFVKLKLTNHNKEKVKETENNINAGKMEGDYIEENLKEDQLNHFKGNKKFCKHCYEVFPTENKLAETKKESDNCCYVYDFESNKGKRNYSFVKIASGKPSHCILDCSCGENLCRSKDCGLSEKNNYVISATVHNLIMEAEKNENQSHNSIDVRESKSHELPQNNYRASHYYNPLPERVIQWLDLASKRNQRGVPKKRTEDVALLGNVERISAGKTYLDENNKFEYSEKHNSKTEDKTVVRKDKVMQKEMSDEDVATEVKGEENIETVLSMEKLDNFECLKKKHFSITYHTSKDLAEEISQSDQVLKHAQDDKNPKVPSIPTKIDPNSLMAALLKSSIAERFNFTRSAINLVQKINFRDDQNEFSCQNKNKDFKEKLDCRERESKSAAGVGSEVGNEDRKLKISAIKFWKRKVQKKNSVSLENVNETPACDCVRNNTEDSKKKIKNLNEEFEKYQKSINNPNITRSKTLSHNSYPQQHNKASWLRDKRTLWMAEKNTIRPQLHIFIPSLPSKEPCDEPLSECESFSNEIS